MNICTTNGIKISVQCRYEGEHSNIDEHRFVHSYQVIIKNESDQTVQLINRHWQIYDSNSSYRQVRGEGVVGKQPVLQPGESYAYTSWCPFNTEIGMMKGTFTMKRLSDDSLFQVRVPNFTMISNAKLN